MIDPAAENRSYEVILNDKHYLGGLVDNISLEEALDEIAYKAMINVVVTADFPNLNPGLPIRVSGILFGGSSMVYLLHPAVVWEKESTNKGQKRMMVVAYDPTIYLARSEDEYLFAAGQTAAQRIKRYASDWDIPVNSVPDTGVQLSKSVYRAQSILNMILSDLKQTVKKGGKMYKPRMTPSGLELYELGTNETVWVFETDQNIEEVVQTNTLENTVTQVKVLGKSSEGKRSPVLALEKGETGKYGTLQKVIQDQDIKTASDAKSAAQEMLCGVQETFTVSGIDVNTIRAGDKVELNGFELLVTSVRHELGDPGSMTLDLASESYVRRRFYSERPA